MQTQVFRQDRSELPFAVGLDELFVERCWPEEVDVVEGGVGRARAANAYDEVEDCESEGVVVDRAVEGAVLG